MAEVVLITSAAKGILSGLLSLASNQIEDPIKQSWGFKKDLEKLRGRLEIIQGFLDDAEDRKITSRAMMVWLTRLKAVACDAENVLDEFAYEALRTKIEIYTHSPNTVVLSLLSLLSFPTTAQPSLASSFSGPLSTSKGSSKATPVMILANKDHSIATDPVICSDLLSLMVLRLG
ncbi:hypothetical protein Vadar_000787 [Vaccinium darrowii]|uniref:Uncharacterized protein n=1 Tax=Vaccinium darrowii TaxID=229202 RepID=A0ACB7XMA4_9ERIC|nr:hypothetical protein Vadar_000787 [Vaccinium darrowii]